LIKILNKIKSNPDCHHYLITLAITFTASITNSISKTRHSNYFIIIGCMAIIIERNIIIANSIATG